MRMTSQPKVLGGAAVVLVLVAGLGAAEELESAFDEELGAVPCPVG